MVNQHESVFYEEYVSIAKRAHKILNSIFLFQSYIKQIFRPIRRGIGFLVFRQKNITQLMILTH